MTTPKTRQGGNIAKDARPSEWLPSTAKVQCSAPTVHDRSFAPSRMTLKSEESSAHLEFVSLGVLGCFRPGSMAFMPDGDLTDCLPTLMFSLFVVVNSGEAVPLTRAEAMVGP